MRERPARSFHTSYRDEIVVIDNPASSAPRHTQDSLCNGVSTLADEQALGWFARLNAPDVTDDDRMGFNRWLGLHPRNRAAYRSVLALWQRLGPDQPTPRPYR